MPLSPKDALDAVRAITNGPRPTEARRLNRIAEAMRPTTPSVLVPPSATPTLRRLAEKAPTNYLPLIVDTFSQVMKVDGYRPADGTEDSSLWDRVWQANQLDARQTGIHRSTLTYGVAYATVLPGDIGPVVRGVSPRRMTALYADPAEDEWPILALTVEGRMHKLYDEDSVYYLGQEGPVSANPALRYGHMFGTGTVALAASSLHFIERRDHNLGVCPVVRYRDRMLLDDDEQMGIVEPIISIQESIDETKFGMLVAQYFAAFRQRYLIGWVPKDEETALRATASNVWIFEDENVKAGEFGASPLAPYIESKDSSVKDMAAISQVPPQNFAVGGVSNLSAEALAAMEAGKDRKADEITTSLGESHEQMFRLAARAGGDEVRANDTSAQVRWKDATARSLAQTADALGKLAVSLGMPVEFLWSKVPGITDTDLAEMKALRAENDALGGLTSLLDQQARDSGL